MRMAVAWIGHETKRLQNGEASGVPALTVTWHLKGRDLSSRERASLRSNAEAPKRRSNIEAPHAPCARYGGVDGHASNPSQFASKVGSKQCLSFMSEALPTRYPLGHEPLQKPVALASRLGSQKIDTRGQVTKNRGEMDL